MKKLLIVLLVFIPINVFATSGVSEEFTYDLYRARILDVETTTEVINGVKSVSQIATAEIINRDKKGEEVEIYNFLSGDPVYDMELKENTIATINYDGSEFHFIGYDNFRPMVLLVALFAGLLLLIGGIKGMKALVALIITISLIVAVMVPLLLRGLSPIFVSVLISSIATLLTFLIISGRNKKTLIATLGTTTGLISGGAIAYIFGMLFRLTGFSSNDATMLLYLPNQINFDFRGLLFAGIIIGALGASMDVSISIASSLNELKVQKPNIKANELVKSGFNIGKDIMGTMINTLVLAYVGGSLTTLLIFVGFNTSFYHIANLDFFATEVVRAVAGSVGLLIAIPATIMFFVIFNFKKEEIL